MAFLQRGLGTAILLLALCQCWAVQAHLQRCPLPPMVTNVTFPTPGWNIPTDFCFEPKAYPQWDAGFLCMEMDDQPSFNLAMLPDCSNINGQDYYGFGVRLGFYFTWFGSWIANQFVVSEISGALDANSIFLFALEVTIFKGIRDDSFLKVDAVIMLLIGAGTTVGAMSIWGYRTAYYRREGRKALRHFGGFGTHVRLALCLGVNVFWLWFWSAPYKREMGLGSCDPRCLSAKIFDQLLVSDVHWALFVLGLIPMVYWGMMLAVSPIALFVWIRNFRRGKNLARIDQLARPQYDTGLSNSQLKRRSYIFATLSMCWLILLLITTEVTLHQNSALETLANSSNTTTPAQLIPLVIGVASFIRTIYMAWRERQPQQGATAIAAQPDYQHVSQDTQCEDTTDTKESKTTAMQVSVEVTDGGASRRTDETSAAVQQSYEQHDSRITRSETQHTVIDHRRFEAQGWLPVRLLLMTWLPWLGLLPEFVRVQPLDSDLPEHPHQV